ncbi:MAG: DUF4263 domain-containing protein [Comamonadaceae bacterium]|jgi:hypothetical protein|nr:DUF4263 domain-containing protein [Comamonadaceae bacterium]
MSQIKGRLAKVLLNKKTVVTRAVFWKIPHDSGKEDIRLKLGRYRKPEDFDLSEAPETLEPKSELTLDQEEFKALVEFLQESYEPFRQGVKAFLPLDRPFDPANAEQIRALFSLPDQREIVRFIIKNNIIPAELAAGLRQARRARAVREFSTMLQDDLREAPWQEWFQRNSWVLGSQFVRVIDERHIDTQHISDFLVEAYDGFLDIVEIKRPEGGLQFWANAIDHGNYVPASDLTKAITQASRYIYEVEREANSVKFLDRVGGVRTVKPRCILIFGRSNDWNQKQIEAYRILNASYHNLTVLTYDHVLARARRVSGIDA